MTNNTSYNENLAYSAGIIDGEGCIGAWNRRARAKHPHAEVSIRIAMTTPFAVKLLHSMFGGSLFAEKRKGGNRRQTFAWVVVSKKAEACLRAVLPFLREKREQAEVALALIEIRRNRKVGGGKPLTDDELAERDAFVMKLRDLKRVEYDPNTIH